MFVHEMGVDLLRHPPDIESAGASVNGFCFMLVRGAVYKRTNEIPTTGPEMPYLFGPNPRRRNCGDKR